MEDIASLSSNVSVMYMWCIWLISRYFDIIMRCQNLSVFGALFVVYQQLELHNLPKIPGHWFSGNLRSLGFSVCLGISGPPMGLQVSVVLWVTGSLGLWFFGSLDSLVLGSLGSRVFGSLGNWVPRFLGNWKAVYSPIYTTEKNGSGPKKRWYGPDIFAV